MANLLKNIMKGGTSYGENPTVAQVINGWTNSTGETTGDNSGYGLGYSSGSTDMQNLNLSGGSYAFAEDLARANFGDRNLTQVIIDNTAEFKKALEPLELELSRLNSLSSNFVPTLKSYMKGKDQYMKFIDSMIDQQKESLHNLDMGDPAVAARYNNYMGYLTTLKGRQNERYGNYLTSAISDYEAEVKTAQDNYDTFYKNAGEILNQQNTLDQNTYNDIFKRGESLYAELDGAYEKQLRIGILENQKIAGDIENGVNGVDSPFAIDPDYFKKVKLYQDNFLVQDDSDYSNPKGVLDPIKIGPEGLIGLYSQVAQTGSEGNTVALTEVIAEGFKKAIQLSGDAGSKENLEKIKEIKEKISQLRDSGYEEAISWADNINNALFSEKVTQSAAYIQKNIGTIRDAVKHLISGYGGFLGIGKKSSGLEDKETWKAKYSSLGSDFLDSLYDTINTAIQPGSAFAEDPSALLDRIFSGTDEEDTISLASMMASS